MELLNNIETVVSPEKKAIRKILKAFNIIKPVVENIDIDNKMALISKLPKVIKLAKDNENELKEVFNVDFLTHLETLAK